MANTEETKIILRIKKAIIKALNLKISPDDIGNDDPLFGTTPGVDSMAILQVLVGIEQEFGLDMMATDLQAEQLINVAAITRAVQQALQAQHANAV